MNLVFLDKNLQISQKNRAVFTSSESLQPTGETQQELETFSTKHYEAAEKNLGKPKPLGPGKEQGETKTLAGFHLRWETDRWAHHSPTFQIEIAPESDTADTEKWLRAFLPIGKTLLNRATIKRETLVFKLGSSQTKKPCVASAWENILAFPTCKDKSHLLAVQIERASQKSKEQVDLQRIILHEIGHTLKKYFPDARQELDLSMADNFARLRPLLETISPHYLGKQWGDIQKKFSQWKIICSCDPTQENKRAAAKFAASISGEVFAETVRHFYLEGCLTQKQKPAKWTGYIILDEFIETLQTERRLTRKQQLGKPAFPQSHD